MKKDAAKRFRKRPDIDMATDTGESSLGELEEQLATEDSFIII